MFDPATHLVSSHLIRCVLDLSDPAKTEYAPGLWSSAASVLGGTREKEPDLAAAIDARDVKALHAIAEAWSSKKRPLPDHDVEILRRALKAFHKSLKLTQLDSESTLGGRGMTSGRQSGIVGITPPNRFPREVWDELVRQGSLRGGRNGVYELPLG